MKQHTGSSHYINAVLPDGNTKRATFALKRATGNMVEENTGIAIYN